MKNDPLEAIRIWNIGKELGFTFAGEDDVIVACLPAMDIKRIGG